MRVIGTPALPTAARQVAFTVVCSIATLNSSDAAYLTQCANLDVWAPHHYLTKTLLTMRQWILNAMVGDAALTPLGGNPGSLSNVNLTGSLSLSETAGASRWVLVLTSLGAIQANTLTSLTIDNTSGWATPLGLVEDGATKTFNASGGVITITGDYQPETTHVFPRSELDSLNKTTRPNVQSIALCDGDVSLHRTGVKSESREYTLVDLSPEHAGSCFPVARFSSFGATRKAVNFKTLATNPGSTDVFGNTALITVGDYIKIGVIDYCARVKAINSTSLDLWWLWPTDFVPVSGDKISIISEAEALEIISMYTAHFIKYGQEDVYDVPVYGQYEDFCPMGEGSTVSGLSQGIPSEPYYSWTYKLQEYLLNKLTLPT